MQNNLPPNPMLEPPASLDNMNCLRKDGEYGRLETPNHYQVRGRDYYVVLKRRPDGTLQRTYWPINETEMIPDNNPNCPRGVVPLLVRENAVPVGGRRRKSRKISDRKRKQSRKLRR